MTAAIEAPRLRARRVVGAAAHRDPRSVRAPCRLPGSAGNPDGLTFVRTVRANPRYAGMKLMMVTTETEVHQVETALAAGANEYLMKPFGKDEVLGKLQLLGLG